MTSGDAWRAGGEAAVVAYEELRSHVLEGALGPGGAGLVVLLRQGLAAWLDGRAASSSGAEREAPRAPRGAAPRVFGEIHARIVGVLANMILAGRGAGA